MNTTIWRTTLARILLGVSAAGAAVSFVIGIGQVMDAGLASQAVGAWRAVGFAAFAAIFGLLAWRPRGYPGVFEVVIANKAALAILGLIGLLAELPPGGLSHADVPEACRHQGYRHQVYRRAPGAEADPRVWPPG